MAQKNSTFVGETHNKSSYSSWWKSRSRKGLLNFLMNDDDEFMEEVTSVAAPDSGVCENVTQFFVLTVTLLAVENTHTHTKRRHHVTFQLSCMP